MGFAESSLSSASPASPGKPRLLAWTRRASDAQVTPRVRVCDAVSVRPATKHVWCTHSPCREENLQAGGGFRPPDPVHGMSARARIPGGGWSAKGASEESRDQLTGGMEAVERGRTMSRVGFGMHPDDLTALPLAGLPKCHREDWRGD
ncbi:unnamed protein product [Diplocarpon coronariae]|nr:hypothetical protein JHW43_001373 [Diplocarpon mali]